MKRVSIVLAMMVTLTYAGLAQWATVYYAGWAKWNATPVDIPQLDFTCGSHWIFFTMAPQGDGTFDGSGSGIDASRHAQFVAAAHAAGAKAIIGTGGWGSDYTGVVSNQSVSVPFLVNLMNTYGYDGVDIDWEPVASAQYANFATFVKALKAAKPGMILTAACFNFDQAIVNNQSSFDQINLMTYDMSGAWTEVSWHNSATFPDGVRPSDQSPLPSIDGSVNAYIAAGVPAKKLGFGIEMYGYVWNGVTGPKQTGFGSIQNTISYATLMDTYDCYGLKWDAVAQASYISAPSKFVSFDAETTLVAKANYLKNKGLGGVIVYEAAAGYRVSQSDPNRLLKTVRYAFLGGPALPPPPPPPPPPVINKQNYTIYTDGALNAPFMNTSWGATADFANTERVKSGSSSVKVSYLDWGAFDINSGQWGSEINLAADSLKFDFYPTSAFPLTVSFYSTTVVVNVVANQWNAVSVPCPAATFTRFYLQRNLAGTATAYVDNIRLVANQGDPPPLPIQLASFSASTSASGGSVLLTWTTKSEVNNYGFKVQRSADATGGFETVSSLVPGHGTSSAGFSYSFTDQQPLESQPYYRLQQIDLDGTTHVSDPVVIGGLTAVPGSSQIPMEFSLGQNYPNPFNPTTTISFGLPSAANVSLRVFNALGQQVGSLVEGMQEAGIHQVTFDGSRLSSGVYFCRIEAGSFVATRKLLLVK